MEDDSDVILIGHLGASIPIKDAYDADAQFRARIDEIERRILAIEARWYESMGENL